MDDQLQHTGQSWYTPQEELEHHLYETESMFDAPEEEDEEKAKPEKKGDSELYDPSKNETKTQEGERDRNELRVSENTENSDAEESIDSNQVVVEIKRTKTSCTSTRVTRSSPSQRTPTSGG